MGLPKIERFCPLPPPAKIEFTHYTRFTRNLVFFLILYTISQEVKSEIAPSY